MRAIVIHEGKLELRDVPLPVPARGEARVRIRACGVNRADVLQRLGAYPAPPDAPRDIPGLEIAGEVDAVGEGVTDVREGDRVFGVVPGGAYAEHVVTHARTLAAIPRGLDFLSAAAIPEAALTAYDAMVLQGGLSAGETVLIHAVGSGVGTAAVQIALATGARAVGTARSEAKLSRAEELGLTLGIVPGEANGAPSFAERVRSVTGGRGADVVLELVGGAYVPESLAALGERGRLVLVGLMAGARTEIDLGAVLRRRLRVFGTVLRARPLEEKIAGAHVLARQIVPLVEDGKLRAVVDRVFRLEEASAAHEHMTSNAGFGKIVLEVG